MRAVRVFAPASVANLGVGFDALGAALEGAGDVVLARATSRKGVRIRAITGDGGRLPRDPEQNTAAIAAAIVLASCRTPAKPGIELSLEKGLPLASGLGSSAASAAAGAFAAAALLGVTSRRVLLGAVLRAEHAADGSWHGDNAFASLLGGLLLVSSSDPRKLRMPTALPFPERLRLVLVHPALELTTSESRRVLPDTVPLVDHVRQSAAFAELVAALARGDLAAAGRAMSSDRIVEPRRAPLVPGYARVVAAMREAGAHGCALAGAGPSLVALTEAGHVPEAVGAAAVAAWAREGIAAGARVHRIDRVGARHAALAG
ncbi:MAG TPA: homoserine kinase [Thermoanaerobaculia bacterium]|nr:homoserine kinase [Thermoanaerobaculia bacterium]